MAEKTLGLFGGLFDPVHLGHVRLVRAALSRFQLDALYVLPTGVPPHKPQPVLTGAQRMQLLERAFQGMPGVRVDGFEIEKRGTSYTVDTLEHFKKATQAELYFFIGADNLSEIVSWREPDRILSLAKVVAFVRPGYPALDHYPQYAGKIRMETMPESPLASSEIRKMLKAGEPVDGALPKAVEEEIKRNGWYR
ncbi:MAG: nicotinate-nucleotide adenylyltransferase [Fibrobacterota bacterium]